VLTPHYAPAVGHYRIRDLWTIPSLISLARLPLAGVFVLVVLFVRTPFAALAVLAASGTTDMLDGWYARKHHMVTPTGAVVDAITDKAFALTVIVTLVATRYLDAAAVLLLTTREIGEFPLVVWMSASRRARRGQSERTMANIPGKLATTLQFATVTAALFRWPHMPMLAAVTAGAGAVAAVTYWIRAIEIVRSERVHDRAA